MKLFSSLFSRRRRERELDAELRFHIERQIEDNVASGMSREDAARAAALEFGGLDKAKEECREVRRFAWIEHVLQDFSYASRQLMHARGFAVTVILTIAIGIGACVTVFSLVNAVLLKPLQFPDPERIVLISETRPGDDRLPVAPAVYLDWAEQANAFQAIAVQRFRPFNTTLGGKAQNLFANTTTANYFSVLGVTPMLGRSFLPEEQIEGKNHVVILSYGIWQQQFGGRKGVIGESMLLDDVPFTIIGVMPNRNLIWNPAFFVPLTLSGSARTDYGSHGLFCVARIKKGTTIESAQSDMDRVSDQIAKAHPESNTGHGAHVSPLLHDMVADIRGQLVVLVGAVAFVLLIACVNVSSLLLARTYARQKEIAVRATLGATRGRIVRQLLCESVLIVFIGGLLGTMIANSSLGAVAHFAGRYVPRTDEITLDGRVLAITFGLILVVGLGVGMFPALQFTRGDLTDALKDAARGSSAGKKPRRLRSILVAGEIALALMLLAGTGLLARSLFALQVDDQGFKTEGVFFSSLSLMGKNYDSSDKVVSFIDRALEGIAALPGVDAVAFTNGLPKVSGEGLLFWVVGTPEVPIKDMPHTGHYAVTPDFFKVLSVPIVQGRAFTSADIGSSPRVVIINRELARRNFGGVDPIGKRLMIMTMSDQPDAIREIVGVAADMKPDGPMSQLTSIVYEPIAQRPGNFAHVVIKMKSGFISRPAGVSEVIRSLDPNLPFDDPHEFRSALAVSWVGQQFSMVVFTVFSAIALLLAAIGIYGVTAYAVGQRTQEIGIRMALGADAREVVRTIGAGGVKVVGVGIVLGLAGSVAFGRVLRSLLFQTSPTDPLTLLAVATLLAAVALIACWVPARRATKIDPLVALRNE